MPRGGTWGRLQKQQGLQPQGCEDQLIAPMGAVDPLPLILSFGPAKSFTSAVGKQTDSFPAAQGCTGAISPSARSLAPTAKWLQVVVAP